MATAPARRRLHTLTDEPPVTTRPTRPTAGGKVQGGRRPSWVTDELVASEAAESERLATRRGRTADRARSAGRRAGSGFGKKRPRGGGTSYRPGRFSAGPGGVSVTGGRISTDAAGVLLAIFTWSWIILPAVTGGPAAVRDTLRAKFFNKDAAGEFLP